MQLSEHFSLGEMTKSTTALRLGIDNTPGEDEIKNLQQLAHHILEPVRADFNIAFSPSSGFRSKALNGRLGSSDRSQHILGEAADFELPGVSNLTLANWISQNLEFDQLILEFYDGEDPRSGWVHCSYREGRLRKEVLTYSKGEYASGLPSGI